VSDRLYGVYYHVFYKFDKLKQLVEDNKRKGKEEDKKTISPDQFVSMGYEETLDFVNTISRQRECSEENLDVSFYLMKRNVRHHQLYVEKVEKYRKDVIFNATLLTNPIHYQWATIEKLHCINYEVCRKLKMERNDEKAKTKKEKEGEGETEEKK